jgi:hypothetical protein
VVCFKPACRVFYCCVVLRIHQIQVKKKLTVVLVDAKIKEILNCLSRLSNVIVCAIGPQGSNIPCINKIRYLVMVSGDVFFIVSFLLVYNYCCPFMAFKKVRIDIPYNLNIGAYFNIYMGIIFLQLKRIISHHSLISI